MSVRTFFNDLLKDLARGGGSIVPAEAVTPVATPSTTPAGDDAGGDVDADTVGGADADDTPPVLDDAGGQGLDDDAGQELDDDADDAGGQGLDDDADDAGGQGLDDDAGQELDDDADDAPPVLDAEKLARRLHAALVAADGRLADPEAVPFDAAHLDDDAALTAAIDAVVRDNPAARARRYGGDIGAGNRGAAPRPPVDLIQLMKEG